MAIRSGQLLFTKDGLLLDRVQTGGISSLNIPSEQIFETGNYLSLTRVRDIPDLSFDIESYDVSCRLEAMLLNIDPSSITSGEQFDFNLNQPFNVLSPFRSSQNYFNTIRGIVIPHLFLESVAYRFGVKQNAQQTYTLRGDSVFYTQGNPYQDTFTSNGSQTTLNLTQTAIPYYNTTLGEYQYALNMSVYNTDGTFSRLFNGSKFDFTDNCSQGSPANGSCTITFNSAASIPPSGSIIKVQYATNANVTPVVTTPGQSPQPEGSITQADNNEDPITTSPAAIRARDIDVYLGNNASTPVFTRWTGVQSVDMTWRVNLDQNEEFGNPMVWSEDYVIAELSGTITTRDHTVTDLFNKLAQATNVSTSQVAGALSSTPVPLEIRLRAPDNGAPLKTLYCPDARFDPPSTSVRVNQKLETPFPFYSDTGLFYVYEGERPGSSWQ